MKLPRKGILIRLAIYLPIIGGLVVWRSCFFEREEVVVEPAAGQPSKGKEFKVIEITPEDLQEMGVELPEPSSDSPAESKSDKSDQAE